ncbi:MAG TPA: hypothetical protein VFC17_09020 [Candidatus Limnocylindrales bacterium]|nr:hypothetical protein [Candidatus Limnocylindrales bacterium]
MKENKKIPPVFAANRTILAVPGKNPGANRPALRGNKRYFAEGGASGHRRGCALTNGFPSRTFPASSISPANFISATFFVTTPAWHRRNSASA